MSISTIGKRIRFFREEKKWSQEVFAEKLGLSLTYIGMIERGEKIPKLETFINTANTLGVSADQLLAGVLTTGYQRLQQVLPPYQLYNLLRCLRSRCHHFADNYSEQTLKGSHPSECMVPLTWTDQPPRRI